MAVDAYGWLTGIKLIPDEHMPKDKLAFFDGHNQLRLVVSAGEIPPDDMTWLASIVMHPDTRDHMLRELELFKETQGH